MPGVKTVFQELSGSLSEHERKELLRRIQLSIQVQESGEPAANHRELGKEERDKLIVGDIEKSSWILKLILWLRSKISGQSVKQLFINVQLRRLKYRIARRYPGITGFETRDLSPKLADEIFGIYKLTLPLRNVFSAFWKQRAVFEKAFLTLIELKITDVKRSATDFVSMEEMESLYAESQKKDSIRDELSRRLDAYVEHIPDSVFSNLEKGILPVYYLKDTVLFPYASFFQLFHFTPVLEDPAAKTYFKSASAMICIERLERLYQAMWMVTKIPESYTIDDDFAVYLAAFDRQDAKKESGEESGKVEGEFIGRIDSLVKKTTHVFERLPITEIIRYFLRDPYYRIEPEPPFLSLEDFYQSYLKIKILAEYDSLFSTVKMNVIDKEVQTIFADKKIVHFQNYREYTSIDYKRLGLPFFRHTRSVTLLYNYIRWFYRGYVQEGVQLLERGILTHNRVTRERLSDHANAVDELGEKIVQFDYSLSPESEEGKVFHRLRFSLAADPEHQRIYSNLILNKDKEVQALLTRGTESLEGLDKIFGEILQSTSDTIRNQLNSYYYLKGKAVTLSSILKSRSEHLNRFRNILNQIIKLERS